MSTTAGRWTSATGSVRGASHAHSGRPNQDAVRVVPVGGSVPGMVAAVCDGHGGDRYVRSDVGSRIAVEVACAVGKRALVDLGPSAGPDEICAYLAGSASSTIVARWRDRVLEDVAGRAFTDEERRTAGAALEGDPLVAYGCTLLLAVFGPEWVGLLQIGDGDVTVVRGSEVSAPVPIDARLVGSETTSLCLPTAVSDARVAALAEPLPDLVVLTSDGYANSFASPTWRTEIGLDLRDHVARLGIEAVEQRLPAWLDDSATAGGDDVSMALIHRQDSTAAIAAATRSGAADATAAPVPTGPRSPVGHGRSAAPARRTGPGVLAGVAAVAALAGIVVGWAFTRGASDSSVAAPPATLGTEAPASTAVLTTLPPPTSAVAPSEPGTTPEETLPAVSRPPDTLPRTLEAGEDVYLLLTPDTEIGVGFVIAAGLDPTDRQPVLLDVVRAAYQLIALPNPWQFDPLSGALRTDTRCYSVLAFRVLPDQERLLAVTADAAQLLLIDTATGESLSERPILGAERLAAYAPDERENACPVLAPQDSPEPETTPTADGEGG